MKKTGRKTQVKRKPPKAIRPVVPAKELRAWQRWEHSRQVASK